MFERNGLHTKGGNGKGHKAFNGLLGCPSCLPMVAQWPWSYSLREWWVQTQNNMVVVGKHFAFLLVVV